MDIDLEHIVGRLKESRKYRNICPQLLARTAQTAARGASSARDAEKRAKRKLHQITSTFVDSSGLKAAERILRQLSTGATEEEHRRACRNILNKHASTRERLGLMENFYERIFEITGRPASVLDVACGFHPFSLPWMGLPRSCRYIAVDVDEQLMSLIRRYFEMTGQAGEALCQDVISSLICPVSSTANQLPIALRQAQGGEQSRTADCRLPISRPAISYDVAFLLKAIPTFEQQESGSALRIIQGIPARFVVVSFPTASIGGHDKDMRENYTETMDRILQISRWPSRRIDWPEELVFILEK